MAIFHATLIPAYGREYKSLEELTKAVHAGADFQVAVEGTYTSGRELMKMRYDGAWIRYDKLRKKGLVRFVR